MSQSTLTAHLTALSTNRPYTAATQHAFLTAAGHRRLPTSLLSLYLSQDRIYAAHAYPRFIGRLLSAIPFSTLDVPGSPRSEENNRILRVLNFALQNVVRETQFFDETAAKHGLQLDVWKERKATRDYTAEMARVVSDGGLREGMIFLWAMERVYLDAWTYVRSLSPASVSADDPISAFVENWTCDEFVCFVDDLGDIVNRFDLQPGSDEFIRAEQIWARAVELEEAFWPVEGDETNLFSG